MDVLEAHRQRPVRERAAGSAGSGSGSIAVEPGEARDAADAIARWPRLMIQPSASSGHTSCSSSVMKSMNSPIVSVARDRVAAAEEEHGRDPERRQEEQAGEEARLDGRLPHRLVRAPPRRGRAKRVAHVVLAAERLHHLDPDDRLVRGLGQVPLLAPGRAREIGKTLVREEAGQDGDRRHRERRDRAPAAR